MQHFTDTKLCESYIFSMTRLKCDQKYLASGIELLCLPLLVCWYHKWKHLKKWSWWYLIHIPLELLGLAIFVGPSAVRRDAAWCLYYNNLHDKCSSLFSNIFNPPNIIQNLYKALCMILQVYIYLYINIFHQMK